MALVHPTCFESRRGTFHEFNQRSILFAGDVARGSGFHGRSGAGSRAGRRTAGGHANSVVAVRRIGQLASLGLGWLSSRLGIWLGRLSSLRVWIRLSRLWLCGVGICAPDLLCRSSIRVPSSLRSCLLHGLQLLVSLCDGLRLRKLVRLVSARDV